MLTNQLVVLYSQYGPKILMFSIMVLKWEYCLMTLILLKFWKNANTETGSFTWKKNESCMQIMNKNVSVRKLKDRKNDRKQGII